MPPEAPPARDEEYPDSSLRTAYANSEAAARRWKPPPAYPKDDPGNFDVPAYELNPTTLASESRGCDTTPERTTAGRGVALYAAMIAVALVIAGAIVWVKMKPTASVPTPARS